KTRAHFPKQAINHVSCGKRIRLVSGRSDNRLRRDTRVAFLLPVSSVSSCQHFLLFVIGLGFGFKARQCDMTSELIPCMSADIHAKRSFSGLGLGYSSTHASEFARNIPVASFLGKACIVTQGS
ncbi:hypothetical protein HN873_023949, partial [Arachis hypogaea]